MNKTSILSILLIFGVFVGANKTFAVEFGGTVKLGIDFPGDYEISNNEYFNGTVDVDTGFSLSGEFFIQVGNNCDLGGGITWQVPHSRSDTEGDFYFIPIYGLIRVRIANDTAAPYLIGQLGINFFRYGWEVNGGLYYGIGAGIIIKKHFLVEVLYSVDKGSTTEYGADSDIEYSKITLNLGYNF